MLFCSPENLKWFHNNPGKTGNNPGKSPAKTVKTLAKLVRIRNYYKQRMASCSTEGNLINTSELV
jgi:hypothetical protein